MQASNRLLTCFYKGEKAFGAWNMLPGHNVARTLARSGVDWVLVDSEHGKIDGSFCPVPYFNQGRIKKLPR
jgi:4-hydroxy-2-oxoheptanedioate aldolase